MATKKLKPGDQPFSFKPKNLTEAMDFGVTLAQTLLNIRTPERERIPSVENELERLGAMAGMTMHREKITWTVNEFTNRFAILANALETQHHNLKSA